MADLFVNATADGDSNVVTFQAVTLASLQITGTWDNATMTIMGSLDDGVTFTEPIDATGRFTSNTLVGILFTSGKVRATISGAGSGTNLTAIIIQS